MFLLGFCVFSSIMLFYLAWESHKNMEKRKIEEWMTLGKKQIDEMRQQDKSPLKIISAVFFKIFGFIFPKGIAAEHVQERLQWAGFTKIDVEGYYTVRILLFIIPVVFYPLLLGNNQFGYLFGAGVGVVLFKLPEFLLTHRIKMRNAKIEKELLPVTELLVTSTQAGLTIEHAIARITRVKTGIFSTILRQGYQYMNGVMTREKAYEWMIKQTNVESVHLFVEAIAQQGKTGTGISSILQNQLSRIRSEIQNKGIAKAQAANGKMMLPTLVFIFLPLIIIMMGPQILALRNF
jgi:pilus assembly protein TadC